MTLPEQTNYSALEQRLNTVFELHENGDYNEAENLYRTLIEDYPSIWQIHFNYGLLLFELGRFSEALVAYQQGLDQDNSNIDLWYNTALCQKSLGTYEEAIQSYQKALSLDSKDLDCLYNLAGCYRVMGEEQQAIQWYEKTLLINGSHLPALNNLAYLYHKNNDSQRAATLYRRILILDPQHDMADHMLASIEGENRQGTPENYIRDVFDQFSDHYDTSLVDKLEYRVPAALLEFMKESFPITSSAIRFGNVLDLGCGTGLTGEVLRPYCNSLTGVDISENMIAAANDKAIYDQLYVQEIQTFLDAPETACYDCIVAADVLPYVGDLKKLLSLLLDATMDEGSFFFSVEALQDDTHQVRLQPSGRFAHGITYIEDTAAKTGWGISSLKKINLRREHDGWITGHICRLVKPAT